MSQYYPGQQSDNDIRCDEGIPTRPMPEKPTPPAQDPLSAEAAAAATAQTASPADDGTPQPAEAQSAATAEPFAATARPDSPESPPAAPDAAPDTAASDAASDAAPGAAAPKADADRVADTADESPAAASPTSSRESSSTAAPEAAAGAASAAAPVGDGPARTEADKEPQPAGQPTAAPKAAPGTTAHIDPVPEDEDIPVLEVAPPSTHSRPAGRAQQLFASLAKIGPLALLLLLAVQIWPIFLTGGRFCPAEWPSVLAALTSLGSGDWLCPSGPQGAQLPLLFWCMGGLHHLLSLGGLPDLLIFPVTSTLCGALLLLAVWALSRASGGSAQAAFASGLMLLSSLLFPLLAHFTGPQPLATALTILSLACLCRGWQKASSPLLLMAGFVFAGLAGLSGGLAYVALPPLTSLVWLLWRLRLSRAQHLDAVAGFLGMLLVVAVWLLALIVFVEADSYLQSVVRQFWHWPLPLSGKWWLPLAAGVLGMGPWLALVPFVSWPRVLRQAPHDLLASRRDNCGSSFLWIALFLAAPLSLLAPGLSGSGPLLCLLAILLGRALLRLSDLGSRIFFLVVALLFLHAGLALTACGFTVTLDWLVRFTSLSLTPEQREIVTQLSGLPVLGILGILCAVILARLVRRGWPGGALLISTLLACVLAQPAHLLLTPQLGAQPSVPLPSAEELRAFLEQRNEKPLPPWYPAPIDLNALPSGDEAAQPAPDAEKAPAATPDSPAEADSPATDESDTAATPAAPAAETPATSSPSPEADDAPAAAGEGEDADSAPAQPRGDAGKAAMPDAEASPEAPEKADPAPADGAEPKAATL